MSEVKGLSGNNRNIEIDIIKGIGIILMVAVHAGGPFSGFINLFHMSVFFIASGLLWNSKNSGDLKSLKNYFIRKIKSLWIPYVICNGTLILLHNTFIKLGVYGSDVQHSLLTEGNIINIQGIYTGKVLIGKLVKNLFFSARQELLSPGWFLETLFAVTIGWAIIEYFVRKFNRRNSAKIILLISSIILTSVIAHLHIKLPFGVHNWPCAFLMYLIGVCINDLKLMNREIIRKYRIVLLAGAFAILVLFSFIGSVSFHSAEVTDAIFFIVVSVSGWIMLWEIATLLPSRMRRMISYVGKHSLWILLLHLSVFKVVSYFYIICTNTSYDYLAASHSIRNMLPGLWVLYLVAGLFIPMILERVYLKLKNKVRQ